MTDTTTLPLASLLADPNNPRQAYDEAALAELADTIRAHGVLQPLLVRPLPGERCFPPDHTHMIVCGHRRARAAALAGLAEVPVVVRELTDAQALELQLIENAQRADVAALEEADAYKRLHTQFGVTVPELMARCGKSRTHVFNRLKLASLCAEGRELVAQGQLAPEAATLVARVGDDKAQAKALKHLATRAYADWSVRKVQELLAGGFTVDLATAKFNIMDAALVPTANGGAGSCEGCVDRQSLPSRSSWIKEPVDTCHNKPCFQTKHKAHAQQVAVQLALDTGKKVIQTEKPFDTWNKGQLRTNGNWFQIGYVPLDGLKRALKDKATKAQAADLAVVVMHPDNLAHALAVPVKAAKEAGLLLPGDAAKAEAQAAAGRGGHQPEPKPAGPALTPEQLASWKTLRQHAADTVAAAIEAQPLPAGAFRYLVGALVLEQGADNIESAVDALAGHWNASDAELRRALANIQDETDIARKLLLAVDMEIQPDHYAWADWADGYDPLAELCKLYGLAHEHLSHPPAVEATDEAQADAPAAPAKKVKGKAKAARQALADTATTDAFEEA